MLDLLCNSAIQIRMTVESLDGSVQTCMSKTSLVWHSALHRELRLTPCHCFTRNDEKNPNITGNKQEVRALWIPLWPWVNSLVGPVVLGFWYKSNTGSLGNLAKAIRSLAIPQANTLHVRTYVSISSSVPILKSRKEMLEKKVVCKFCLPIGSCISSQYGTHQAGISLIFLVAGWHGTSLDWFCCLESKTPWRERRKSFPPCQLL